ncbi:putative late blight resistance protein homolog R1A-10 [Nicotiana tomentosiformis]|uniref:putative late blight resistance protein homolog R1A-10 n=1 Tax=Nicotiana tomentosiformis TaxID=4098 RepID=UPI00388CBC69
MEDVNIDESAPTPRPTTQVTEEEPVGLEDDAEEIIKLLTRGIRERDIVSIFGMPGLGKTTLAKKIFKDSSIVSHFDIRAWLTISQSYDVRELLRNIYKQVAGVKYNGDKESDIADMLRKCLMGKRYLIVLDDVWEVEAWDELRLCFPIGKQGSRIMLTTRLKHVAMEVKNCTDPYSPRFLTREASWKLLEKKAFQKETCPPEFQDVGVQIAEYCKGLPLTVVLIGGILAKKERNVSEWCEVANNLKSHLGAVESESNLAIQLSYCYLPDHLKHCLLTMGVFREDEKFGASKLMLLWMAEGLIQCSDERGLEEVAEGYLIDIISSSLLMVSKTTFDGKVKYLQIHDLVRDFVLNKAKEEKFMQVIGTHNQYQPSYDEEHRVCIHLDDKLRHDLERFNNKVDRFLTSGSKKGTSFGQDLKSFFVTNNADDFLAYKDFWNSESSFHGTVSEEYLSRSYHFSSVGDLRLLRVLDFKNCIPGDYTNIVDILQSLVYLRYLGMCFEKFFFEWVSHMCDLETLLVDTERVVEGTPHIWKMTKLKHVDLATLLPREIFAVSEEGPSKLENLRAFKGMCLSREDIELIERFPNLQKLLLIITDDIDEANSLVLKLDVLTQLQSLVLGSMCDITKYYLPSSLKELIFRQVNIQASATSTIAALPNLQRLIFQGCRFEQEEWDVRDMEFPVLKILKFRSIHLREWHVSESSSFPMLESLVLRSVELLEKIPDSFVDIGTLTSLKVIYCDDNLKASALEIKEEVEETTGCDNLKVYIFPHYSREQKEKEEDYEEEEKTEEVEEEEEAAAEVEAEEAAAVVAEVEAEEKQKVEEEAATAKVEAEKKEDEEEDDKVTELLASSFKTFNLGCSSSSSSGGSRSRSRRKTEGRRRSSNIKSRSRKEKG